MIVNHHQVLVLAGDYTLNNYITLEESIMKSRLIGIMFFMVIATAVVFAAETEKTSQDYSSVSVVSLSPQNGATTVDAASTKKLIVTFSSPMDQRGYSFVIVKGKKFPPTTGKAIWINSTTIELPVSLAPGTTYTLYLNGGAHMNFMDASGKPLKPTHWTFTTS